MDDEIRFYYNNKVEIDTEDGLYKSTIQEIGNDYFGISIPMNSGKYLTLPKDKMVEVLYYLDRDVYKFKSKVIGTKIEKILVIVLEKPSRYKKVQRRNYARASMLINVSFAMREEKEYKYYAALMLDLSGGGARIRTKNKMEPGEMLIISIPLKDENITVKGQVVRIENDRNDNASIEIYFIDIEESVREKIIKHVFNIMREQRQKSAKGD